mmetsp:Transcript_40287/g.75461  ORF Transcript_40287/g.75461 Transcript_40287/m.75461 type:complete len:226 (+) Transcript_40287:2002-2679(+)
MAGVAQAGVSLRARLANLLTPAQDLFAALLELALRAHHRLADIPCPNALVVAIDPVQVGLHLVHAKVAQGRHPRRVLTTDSCLVVRSDGHQRLRDLVRNPPVRPRQRGQGPLRRGQAGGVREGEGGVVRVALQVLQNAHGPGLYFAVAHHRLGQVRAHHANVHVSRDDILDDLLLAGRKSHLSRSAEEVDAPVSKFVPLQLTGAQANQRHRLHSLVRNLFNLGDG